jgi:flavin-dependent thymidylate synthase
MAADQPGKGIEKWADSFMFKAEASDAAAGPQVYLLGGPNDPLGQIAACAKMYLGEVVRDLADVTDDERRYYAEQMKLTKLKMPLEAVSLHFMIEGVTRGFTHQMVRQRTAAYAQESTRFAVKEDLGTATALPPSLAGTVARDVWLLDQGFLDIPGASFEFADDFIERYATPQQQQRFKWDEAVAKLGVTYMQLVNGGMPAEDARGLMPTNITTRLNYITNLRGLLDHAGNRLCTQAQFEWRMVFAQIANALRTYGRTVSYRVKVSVHYDDDGKPVESTPKELIEQDSAWQYDVLASILQPICYQTGKCEFMANFDRKCSIRSRVQANHEVEAQGRSPENWSKTWLGMPVGECGPKEEGVVRNVDGTVRVVDGIDPREWLMDPKAAR